MASIKIIAAGALALGAAASSSAAPGSDTAVLAGGCFWGMEAVFEHVKGVTDVVSGYAGGSAANAHYDDADSGHAEAVKITYDPTKVSYATLLQVYFAVAHNPTEVNRQGPDWGTQYRTAIFFHSANQQAKAQYKEEVQNAKINRKADKDAAKAELNATEPGTPKDTGLQH